MGNSCGCFGEKDVVYEGDDELDDDEYEYYNNYEHNQEELSQQTDSNVDLNAIANELATGVNTINSPRGARPRGNSDGAVLTTDVQKKKADKRRRNTLEMYKDTLGKSPKNSKNKTKKDAQQKQKKGKKKSGEINVEITQSNEFVGEPDNDQREKVEPKRQERKRKGGNRRSKKRDKRKSNAECCGEDVESTI